MALTTIICAHCGALFDKEKGQANRARRRGLPLYCNQTCAGLAHRKHKTAAQKKQEKRLYDIEYRTKNRKLLRAKKNAYFQRTYDPNKARIERKKTMPRHVEYCRQPRYKTYKREYDRRYRARDFGEFGDAYLLSVDLAHEILSRVSRYDIDIADGTVTKSIKRKRDYARTLGNRT